MILSNETFGRVLRKMETSVDTSIEGEIYYSSGENNLCKPKRVRKWTVTGKSRASIWAWLLCLCRQLWPKTSTHLA